MSSATTTRRHQVPKCSASYWRSSRSTSQVSSYVRLVLGGFVELFTTTVHAYTDVRVAQLILPILHILLLFLLRGEGVEGGAVV